MEDKDVEKTFEEIMAKYSCMITKICYYFSSDSEDFKDLRQEVFFNIWKGIEKYRIPALIYWVVFFTIEAMFDLFLLLRIKEVDIYNATIKEVAERSASNWKIHKIGILIGLPPAFGAIILFALAVDANQFTIFGMIFGGVIGFIIGIYQLFKFRRYYRFLQITD